jgi:DNA-binding NarL/FixJ family response regulator
LKASLARLVLFTGLAAGRFSSLMKTNIVIVDDVRSDVAALEDALRSESDFSVTYTPWTDPVEIESVLKSIQESQVSVILLDVFFDGEEKGDKIYRRLKQANDNAQVIVLSVREDVATQKKYMDDLGAYDYFIKDCSPGVIKNVIARIKLAGDKGVQYVAEFDKIDQNYTQEPEHALYLFEALFKKGFNNLRCYKLYASRLKAYFGRSFNQNQFPYTALLELMLANSQRVETADPADYENLLDMAAVYLHRGEEQKATSVFRKVLFADVPSSVTNRIFSWLESLYYGQTLHLPDVGWLKRYLIDEKDQGEQRILITALRDYKPSLWQDALVAWFKVLEDLWDQGNKKQAAEQIVWLLGEYGARDIRDVISTLGTNSTGNILQLCEAAGRLAANEGTSDLEGLVELLEFLFDARDVSALSETEKRAYLKMLEETLFLTLDSNDSSEEIATRIYTMMSRLQFSTAEMIQNVRSNIKSELPDLWNKYLLKGIKYLNTTGKASELHSVINSNKDDLFNGLDPDALAEMGGILDETKSPLSSEFYQEAIGKYLKRADAAKSEDDLFEPKRLILLLEERKRSDEVKILKDQLKQIKARLSKPILELDEERIAILGGREENKDRYGEKLAKRFGGSYKWYDGVDDAGSKNLIKSLGQWKYTMVIFITGASKHDTFTPVHEAIKNLNKNFGGSIKEIVLGTSDVGPDSVANGVQDYIANPKSANA